ncbi:MAG TPA: carboxypeptidase-like regulatory domain-containing protein [Pyrinomonadaceae bacterium]|nr:carboxypeptidase-like regulatory domain-containing protein [Pyrinomonadaceae bacterium]
MKFTGLMKNNNEDLLNKIVRLMQTDNSADAPADSIEWSKNLFLSRAAEPKKSLVQKVLAVLQMDLSPDKAAFGERSASSSQIRQMLFGAGDHQIDLRIAQANKGFTVTGQVLGEDSAGAEIALFSGGKNFTVKTNELGEFRFENISKDKYTLSLTFKGKEIIIESIEIG